MGGSEPVLGAPSGLTTFHRGLRQYHESFNADTNASCPEVRSMPRMVDPELRDWSNDFLGLGTSAVDKEAMSHIGGRPSVELTRILSLGSIRIEATTTRRLR
jgi:hypothetical protein